MSGFTGSLTFTSIIIIAAIIFVTVGIFVMFAILCANVAQIKKTVGRIHDAVSKKKSQISVDYLRPKI